MVSEDVLFNLMGNETRRMILKMLATGPRYTTEIAEKLQVGQKAINEHMRLLQEAGIVDLYIQKQSRGSPRKYFKINKSVRLEFIVAPYRFDTVLSGAIIDLDSDNIIMDYPQLQLLEEEIKKSKHVQEMTRLTELKSSLDDELEKINAVKGYLEQRIELVRQRCLLLCDEIGLESGEKSIIMEIVNAGGTASIDHISEELHIERDSVKQSIIDLKKKGIIKTV